MCGIVAASSHASVTAETVAKLARLEYRGYDSYGVAVLDDGEFQVIKGIGSVSEAVSAGQLGNVPASGLAIGHTRWATNGSVSLANAHPHLSFDGSVAVAHNGVIANHWQLRLTLASMGVTCVSETDSEVIGHIIALHIANGASTLQAIISTVDTLTGEYAFVVAHRLEPAGIYGAKSKSPLVAYYDGQVAILASDALALSNVGPGRLIYLEDGDVIRLNRESAGVFARDGGGAVRRVARRRVVHQESDGEAGLGGFAHYMIKEIHETPVAAARALAISDASLGGVLPISDSRPVTLFGAGSGYYVSQIGQYLLRQLAGISAIAAPSDEAQESVMLQEGDGAIAISQSGETFDTLEMCRIARERGALLTSICNVPQSTQERLSNRRLQQRSGAEISVLSTKSLISQVVLLTRLALYASKERDYLPRRVIAEYYRSLGRVSDVLQECIAHASAPIRALAVKYDAVLHWFFIGRGIFYPVALEDALKFKEGTYRHAEGMSAGFFKHGTIALVSKEFVTVALIPPKGKQSSTLASVSEIYARGGTVCGFGAELEDERDSVLFSDYIVLPSLGSDIADSLTQLVAGQLLAYYYALNLGREIDQPRHLAKSVTVR